MGPALLDSGSMKTSSNSFNINQLVEIKIKIKIKEINNRWNKKTWNNFYQSHDKDIANVIAYNFQCTIFSELI